MKTLGTLLATCALTIGLGTTFAAARRLPQDPGTDPADLGRPVARLQHRQGVGGEGQARRGRLQADGDRSRHRRCQDPARHRRCEPQRLWRRRRQPRNGDRPLQRVAGCGQGEAHPRRADPHRRDGRSRIHVAADARRRGPQRRRLHRLCPGQRRRLTSTRWAAETSL